MKNLKSLTLFTIGFFTLTNLQAQIDVKEKAKDKTISRADSKVDETIDKGLDKIEEGIGNFFKKKPKAEGGKEEQGSEKKTDNAEKTEGTTSKSAGSSTTPAPETLKGYSKFDFVPGENTIAYDDFSRVDIGDFPGDWNSSTSGEVVTLNNAPGKFLMIADNGTVYPEYLKDIPENATIEFTAVVGGNPSVNYEGFYFSFVDAASTNLFSPEERGSTRVYIHPGHSSTRIVTRGIDGSVKVENSNPQNLFNAENRVIKVSIWRQKTRIRVYLNERKVWDIPRAFEPGMNYKITFTRSFFGNSSEEDPDMLYLSNFKVAVGNPDTRNKLLTEGKFVTNAITFDVNKATVKAESYPTIKEIATVLSENPNVRVKVIGHTDSDGAAATNLTLSKQRAEAVKQALVTEFGISASRIEVDGLGSTKPLDTETTATAKAKNRRVEFVKL